MAKQPKTMYEWQSMTMGNIVNSLKEVRKQMWESLVKHHTLDIKWRRKKRILPTFICAAPTYIDKQWYMLVEPAQKKQMISDFLLKTYGYAHNGFNWESSEGAVTITNIKWVNGGN